MRKVTRYGWKVLQIYWNANGLLAVISIFSTIYQNTLFPFLQIFFLAKVLDLIQKQHPLQFSSFLPYIIMYGISGGANIFLTTYLNLKQFYIDTKFETYIDRLVIKKLSTLDPATFEKPDFQELLTETDGAKGAMNRQLDRLTGFINAIAKILTASFVLLPVFPQFIPIIFISVFPSYYLFNKQREQLWPFFSKKRNILLRIAHYVKNLLSQENTSKEAAIFLTGNILQQKVDTEEHIYFRDYLKVDKLFSKKILSTNFFQYFVFLFTQYFNIGAVLRGTLGVGQFTLAFQQSLNLATGSQAVLDMYASMQMRIQLIERFFEFLNYQPTIVSPKNPVSFPAVPLPPKIEFMNVTFRYPNTERNILHDFNLILNPGEKIALVGENGAGKTTIIKLLLRFYDVTEGELLINGVNIKELSLTEWHKQVGALFQDFIKYQFTFKENVYFGNIEEQHNETLLWEAIMKAGADKYVDSLPKNIDQIVGKMFHEGIDLSGGQWQKLALARAFFRNAPILILDEPTAAIDAKAEYEIFENVQKLQKDKTVLIISHRFSTVRNADRILVLDEGKILEEGSHEDLMKKKGLYAELFDIQAKEYK